MSTLSAALIGGGHVVLGAADALSGTASDLVRSVASVPVTRPRARRRRPSVPIPAPPPPPALTPKSAERSPPPTPAISTQRSR